jgi:hypothetical protein
MYTIQVKVDPNNKITDAHRSNNAMEEHIEVTSGGPPAPTGCSAEVRSSSVVRISFHAPVADPSEYDGFKVYEGTLGLRTTILGAGSVDIMALDPNKHYYFYVVSYKGAWESAHDACTVAITTPP